jgi:hypothetical protein
MGRARSVRHNFDRRYGGITGDWHEFQKQLALGVGFKTFDRADQGPILPGLFDDVEIGQDCLAVAEDVEYPTPGSCGISARPALADECFRGCAMFDEMQSYGVLAASNGDRVGEVPPTFGLVELGIFGDGGGFLAGAELSPFEVSVGTPPVTIIGIVRHIAGNDAHRAHLAVDPRQNLDGGKHRPVALHRREAEMQLAVCGRRDVGEDLHFGSAVAARISEHVEVLEQELAVGKDRHDAASLTAAPCVFRTVECLGEVQMEFVRARLQRNVVSEIALSAAAIDDGILRPPDVLDCALNWVAAGEARVGTPKLAGMIHISLPA